MSTVPAPSSLAGAFFDALPVAAFVHDRETVLGANRAGLSLVGATCPDELRGLSVSTVEVTGIEATYRLGDGCFAIVAACADGISATRVYDGVSRPPSYDAATPLLDAALDAFPLPVVAVCDRRFTYANRAALDVLRFGRARELLGRSLYEIAHPDSVSTIIQQLWLMLTTGVTLTDAPIKARAADGTAVTARGTGARVSHEGSEYAIFVATSVAS